MRRHLSRTLGADSLYYVRAKQRAELSPGMARSWKMQLMNFSQTEGYDPFERLKAMPCRPSAR